MAARDAAREPSSSAATAAVESDAESAPPGPAGAQLAESAARATKRRPGEPTAAKYHGPARRCPGRAAVTSCRGLPCGRQEGSLMSRRTMQLGLCPLGADRVSRGGPRRAAWRARRARRRRRGGARAAAAAPGRRPGGPRTPAVQAAALRRDLGRRRLRQRGPPAAPSTPHVYGPLLAFQGRGSRSPRSGDLSLEPSPTSIAASRAPPRRSASPAPATFLDTQADCMNCSTPASGGPILATTLLLNTVGPRVDFTPFGVTGPYLGATGGLAVVTMLDRRVGGGGAARAGFRLALADALIVGTSRAGCRARPSPSGGSSVMGFGALSGAARHGRDQERRQEARRLRRAAAPPRTPSCARTESAPRSSACVLLAHRRGRRYAFLLGGTSR